MAFLDKTQLLNDRIIQQLYRIKTIDRNSEWDVIWYLGGKNQITLGEKAGKYYLLPPEDLETGEECFMGMDKLPGDKNLVGEGTLPKSPQLISTIKDLESIYPELILFDRSVC